MPPRRSVRRNSGTAGPSLKKGDVVEVRFCCGECVDRWCRCSRRILIASCELDWTDRTAHGAAQSTTSVSIESCVGSLTCWWHSALYRVPIRFWDATSVTIPAANLN
jgi:hypothetical protein